VHEQPPAGDGGLTGVVRRVAEEYASAGRALPVPPDRDGDDLDCEFWDTVASRLTAERQSPHID
jgi:hypothetical protein